MILIYHTMLKSTPKLSPDSPFKEIVSSQMCFRLAHRYIDYWRYMTATNLEYYWTSSEVRRLFKGTISRDWDVLLVVWMDRALFWDEPLIVFLIIYCFLVLTLNFTLLREIALLDIIGVTLLQMCLRLLATLWQICYRGKRALATLWQIFIGCQRLLAILWQIPPKVLTTFVNST